ncbi:S1C family serine protease [Streptomyces sp. NPDC056144]|uniref:S1C family serine protease n=1 Tax=unclassified Streptomyces TaxID=2593676 RepID=UPI0035D72036
MNDGKPNWWSRPSTAPEPPREPAPAPAPEGSDGDFPLPAPQPSAGDISGAAEPAPSAVPAEPTDTATRPDPADAAPAVRDHAAPAASTDDPAEPRDTAVLLTKGESAAAAEGSAPAGADHAASAASAETPGVEPAPAASPTPAEPAAQAPAEPAAQAPAPAEPAAQAPAPAEPAAQAPAEPAAQAPEAARPQPLHAPDEYRTPPYGEPGPWAPAPPVQHPAAAPAPAPGAVPPPQGAVPPAPPQQGGGAPWMQYDPWGGPAAPLPVAAKKKSRKGLAVAGALVFALITGVIGGGIGAYVERNNGLTTVELPQAEAGELDRAPDSVAGIAAGALPGVVTLHVSGGGSAGTGTGFVLDTKGHILTNNHVVDAAESSGEISVTFSSGETARAKLVGKDTGYDLAVVQVTGVSGLKPLALGNSDNVRVGDPVVAIGAPFDLSNTVTSGIISAKERPITAGGEKGDGTDISYVDALQTDAPINPGNSGGPLLDSKGRVIGINSAIRAAGGGGSGDGEGSASQPGSIGLGFAIPINQGKRVAEELINTGKATHPVIGVSLDMQYQGDGARVGEKGKDGAASVTPGGPAARAGLRPGDVITKVDGQRVHNGEELIVKIRAHRPGDQLELTLTRGGKELIKTLTLGSSQGT